MFDDDIARRGTLLQSVRHQKRIIAQAPHIPRHSLKCRFRTYNWFLRSEEIN